MSGEVLHKEFKQYAALESMLQSRTSESSKEDRRKGNNEDDKSLNPRFKRLKK